MNRLIPSVAILLLCGSACVAEVEDLHDEGIDDIALEDDVAPLADTGQDDWTLRRESPFEHAADHRSGEEAFESITVFETVEEPDPQPWIPHPDDDDPRDEPD